MGGVTIAKENSVRSREDESLAVTMFCRMGGGETENCRGEGQEVDILAGSYLGSNFLLRMLGTKLSMGAYLCSVKALLLWEVVEAGRVLQLSSSVFNCSGVSLRVVGKVLRV